MESKQSIAFMATKDQVQRLVNFGYKRKLEINKMTPQRIQDLLRLHDLGYTKLQISGMVEEEIQAILNPPVQDVFEEFEKLNKEADQVYEQAISEFEKLVSPTIEVSPAMELADREIARLGAEAVFDDDVSKKNGHRPKPKSICMANVVIEQVDWLWEKRIPLKLMTMLQGIEGVGKSTLLTAIVAAVTTGSSLPEMDISKPANVLWLSAEDHLGMMLLPRLIAAGADVNRVFAIDEPFRFDREGIELLYEEVTSRKPKLIIIDPIISYMQGDPNKGSDTRSILSELKLIPEKFNTGMVLVRHVNKSKGFGDPRAAGMYSIEWRAAVRSELLAGCDPDQPERRALTQTKNNLSPLASSIEYSIIEDLNSPSKARFKWGGVSDLTAKRMLESIATDDATMARQLAEEFLKEILQSGELPATEVQAEARANGISERTLDRAKARLRVRSRKISLRGPWLWSLELRQQERHILKNGNLDISDGDSSN